MPKTTVKLDIDWTPTEEGEASPAVVSKAIAGTLKDYTETIDFGREVTDEIRDEQRLEGYIEMEGTRAVVSGKSRKRKAPKRKTKKRPSRKKPRKAAKKTSVLKAALRRDR